MKASEVLGRAVGIMQEKGHHKGSWQDPRTEAVCLYGSVNMAVTGHAKPWNSIEMQRLADIYHQIDPVISAAAGIDAENGYALVSWNDNPAISAEDILLVMKKAAEALREEGN